MGNHDRSAIYRHCDVAGDIIDYVGDAVMPMDCPEHGAMLCYGRFGDFRLYRCERGHCKIKKTVSRKGKINKTVEYIQVTHREVWVYDDGRVVEIEPHTLMREGKDC